MAESRSFIQHAPIPLCVIGGAMQVLEVNRPMLGLLNFRFYPDDYARNCREVAAWLQARPELCALLRKAMARAAPSALPEKFAWQDGNRFLRFCLAPDDQASAFIVAWEDYTEQMAMQVSHAQARSYLESIMTSLYIGIIVADRALQITNMNRTQEVFLQKTGHPISLLQAIGMPLQELLPDENELLDKIRKEVLEEGVVCGGIVERGGPPGAEKIFSVSFYPLRNEHNAIVGIIRVCEDITEKIRLEEELRHAEVQALEIQTIRKVIITLNHEINNALMVVMGNAEVLLRLQKSLPEEQRDMLRGILAQAEKISFVTQQLGTMEVIKSVDYLQDGPKMIAVPSPSGAPLPSAPPSGA